MIKYENECVGCPSGCVEYCKYKRVPHYFCDVCGAERNPDDLFNVFGEMMCVDCAEENYSVRELMEALYGTVQE